MLLPVDAIHGLGQRQRTSAVTSRGGRVRVDTVPPALDSAPLPSVPSVQRLIDHAGEIVVTLFDPEML